MLMDGSLQLVWMSLLPSHSSNNSNNCARAENQSGLAHKYWIANPGINTDNDFNELDKSWKI